MATIVRLLSVADLKSTGYVDENVDEKIIGAAIESAQDIYTRDIIGSGIFDELKTQIQASTTTALNITLLTYIAKSLKYWTLWEGLAIFNYKIRNKAVMTSNSDNSNPVSASDLATLGAYFKDKAEYYDQRLIRYLQENQSSYPLYYNPGNGVDTIHPRSNAYSTGWVMGNRNDCDIYHGPDSTIDL